ncbi:MAG: hypothetical protein ABF483_04560 [Liquorilactobacillus nagelii]|jgi:hypothetical protein|uniref:Uncharacterized protein n=1 Tax=Liquorilactobacillus nagelii TaxID=82688 RepID=A0A3Q8CGA5_9LACO|nr:hypothetical protein [Liquorilactobacillus nagelii]AUJ31910.1 hypothetical protein BSQ50_04655 [Liquorilactobacillus nagelii]MCC7615703.1 hypothetical protein [Liquorilactobacillus nagelii]MCP9314009.1 hypothetical protein [Liquorilactobacillus nagelii]
MTDYEFIINLGGHDLFTDSNRRQVLDKNRIAQCQREYRLPAKEFVDLLDELNRYHRSGNQQSLWKKIEKEYLNLGNLIIK